MKRGWVKMAWSHAVDGELPIETFHMHRAKASNCPGSTLGGSLVPTAHNPQSGTETRHPAAKNKNEAFWTSYCLAEQVIDRALLC